MGLPSSERSVAISARRRDLIVLIFVGLAIVGGVGAATFPERFRSGIQIFDPPFGLFLMASGALVTGIAALRLAGSGRPALTLDARGFWDRRILAQPLPWDAILGIGTGQHQKRKYLVLVLAPGETKELRRTPFNALLALAPVHPRNQLWINDVGLDIDLSSLALQVFASAAIHGRTLQTGAALAGAGMQAPGAASR